MSYKTLPYLESLRTKISAIAPAMQGDPELAAPCNVSANLLDRMIVDHSIALKYQSECYAGMNALLPAIEAELPPATPDQAAIEALRELATICSSSDTSAFGRFIHLCSELQRILLKSTTASAATIVKKLVGIEAG